MKRRQFLKRALAGAAGAQIAAWTGACAGRDTPEITEDLHAGPAPTGFASPELLRAAWKQARAEGRPLFVLVIPSGNTRWEHGEAWGELLLHGSESTLARLAGCRLACAEMSSVRAVLGDVDGVPESECTALFVRADGARAEAMNADVTLERWPDWDEEPEAQEKPFRDRIARLESAIAGVVVGPAGDPARLADEPPPGAAWAESLGCGAEVIDHPEIGAGIACGMGHVPNIAQKFLYYLTEDETR